MIRSIDPFHRAANWVFLFDSEFFHLDLILTAHFSFANESSETAN
jgi:hypothetical protein